MSTNDKKDLGKKEMKTKYDPAFPITKKIEPPRYFVDADGQHIEKVSIKEGLTKRELIAAMAMQGHLASMNPGGLEAGFVDCVAKDCVRMADALLAELAK